jgi:hypothetical protein
VIEFDDNIEAPNMIAIEYVGRLLSRLFCPEARRRAAMLEHPHSYHIDLDALSVSLPPYSTKASDALLLDPAAPDDDNGPDSPPSALSSSNYSPYTHSHGHRRSTSFDSSVSPPTSAHDDPRRHHRLAVEDPHFAFLPPPQSTQSAYFYPDRRQSEPNTARYRPMSYAANSLAASVSPLSSSLPTSTAFPQEQSQVQDHYPPRPSSSFAFSASTEAWDAPSHSDEQGPFTTAPVNAAAHGPAITATSAALAASQAQPAGLVGKLDPEPYFDDGAWLEHASARPNTADSASSALPHGYGHAPEQGAMSKFDDAEELGQTGSGREAGSEGRPAGKSKSGKTYSFVPLPGNAVKKRPRRRYDEIERLYRCR